MAYHKVIGIDLGTTNSAVSIWDIEKQEVAVIPSAIGTYMTPSVVGLDPEGRVVIGAPALNNLLSDPENTITEVKRMIGKYHRNPDPHIGDPGLLKTIRFRERDYLPQEIVAFILMELKRQAENYIGEPIHDAVIAVPNYFKDPEMVAMREAATIARLNVKLLLSEPTAAAVYFGANKVTDGRKHIYAVYDLGGGTFDVSIIEVSKDNVSVVGTGGNPNLGGNIFDDRIAGFILERIKVEKKKDFSRDPFTWLRIKREAEPRKCDLAAAKAVLIHLPYLKENFTFSIPLTRAVFEALIEDYLQKSLQCLDLAIQSAYESNGITREEIEQVLLVGGSTRIPRIRTLLAEHMGMDVADVRCDFNPDEVVSRGAAILAQTHEPSDAYEGTHILFDVVQSDYALLGVSPSASEEEIRTALTRVARELAQRESKATDIKEREILQDWQMEIFTAAKALLNLLKVENTPPNKNEQSDSQQPKLLPLQEELGSSLVFISAKMEDYGHARLVYDLLKDRGVPAFFSPDSLPLLGDADYRRAIDRALDGAQHMIVVTSCRENVESPWVEAEWGLFVNEKRSGRKTGNLITVVFSELTAKDLPASLRYYEVIPFREESEESFERILRYVSC